MRFVTTLGFFTIAISGLAHAGAALDDSSKPAPTTQGAPGEAATPVSPTVEEPFDKTEYGIDLRLRQVFLPQALIGAFINHAAGGASNTGIGFDLVRRRGNSEVQLGFEYEHVNLKEGTYIN